MTAKPSHSAAKRKPRFIYLLSAAQRRVESAIQADGGGKTAARAGLVLALKADGSPMPTAELGAALDIGPSTLSGLIDRMARDGLVERRADPLDGRAWQIALTEAGKEVRADAVRSARQLNDQLCEGFDEAELVTIERWLEAVRTKFPPRKI